MHPFLPKKKTGLMNVELAVLEILETMTFKTIFSGFSLLRTVSDSSRLHQVVFRSKIKNIAHILILNNMPISTSARLRRQAKSTLNVCQRCC